MTKATITLLTTLKNGGTIIFNTANRDVPFIYNAEGRCIGKTTLDLIERLKEQNFIYSTQPNAVTWSITKFGAEQLKLNS